MNAHRWTSQSLLFGATIAAALLTGCQTQEVSANGTAAGIKAGAAAPGLVQVTIPLGTIVRVRTMETLSTRTARAGETVSATLESPLVISGAVVAPQGALATLLVADSNPGGRIKGRAHIGLRLASIQIDGQTKPVVTTIAWHQARGTKGKDAAKIAGLGGAGAVIGALTAGGKGAAIGAGAGGGAGTVWVLTTRGDPAVIPVESVVQFSLTQPLAVSIRN